MRQVLNTNAGILLSDEELFALEKRYNDSMGFSYMWFLKEADPQDYAIPKVRARIYFNFSIYIIVKNHSHRLKR